MAPEIKPVPVILLGNRVFSDIIKIKWGHTGSGWIDRGWGPDEQGGWDAQPSVPGGDGHWVLAWCQGEATLGDRNYGIF